MRTSLPMRAATCGLAAMLCTTTASGIVVTIDPVDTPDCDPLILPNVVHELGHLPFFPLDEAIETAVTITQIPACLPMDDTGIPNALVIMTNISGIDWMDVHYVGDAQPGAFETFLSNPDGLVSGGLAFRIDTIGVNTPLIGESMTPDGIFEAGETWEFIVQDYSNVFGLPADAFETVAAVGTGSGGDPLSSASIIALRAVPAPGSMVLLAVGTMLTAAGRRRSH